MLQYKYLAEPKMGDLVGWAYAGYRGGARIAPAVIVGFGKAGNIKILRLEEYNVKGYKADSKYYWKTIPKNRLESVIPIDIKVLTPEELKLYNHLTTNAPL